MKAIIIYLAGGKLVFAHIPMSSFLLFFLIMIAHILTAYMYLGQYLIVVLSGILKRSLI